MDRVEKANLDKYDFQPSLPDWSWRLCLPRTYVLDYFQPSVSSPHGLGSRLVPAVRALTKGKICDSLEFC